MRSAIFVLVPLLAALPVPAQVRSPAWPLVAENGHEAWSSAIGNCTLAPVDIAATGVPLALTASGAASAADDGAAVLSLAVPFEFSGRSHDTVVVSSNGYLAFAGDLGREAGGDFSDDCPMPAVPQPGPGESARVLVLHGDLDGSAGGQLLHQFFATCPRVSEALGTEPCTAITWQDWSVPGGGEPYTLQAILYHASSQIVTSAVASSVLPAGTAGLQGHRAGWALAPTCEGATLAPAGTALCYYDPRFPAGGPTTDLALQTEVAVDEVAPLGQLEIFVSVSNLGPSPVTGAAVTSVPSSGLACSWTCEAGVGASCTPGPVSGVPFDAPDLPPGSVVAYTLECLVDGGAGPSVSLQASVAPAPGATDPSPEDASDLVEVAVADVLFADGFEDGTTTRWSLAIP